MRKSRKYNSYKGNVGKVAINRLSRRFSTPIPLQKLVTDITELKCLGEEKLYLNPILDLYNGEIIAYEIKKTPNVRSCHGTFKRNDRDNKESCNLSHPHPFRLRMALPTPSMGEDIKGK